MGSILSKEDWVEIPAGEAVIGLSQAQRDYIVKKLVDMAMESQPTPKDRSLVLQAAEKLRQFSGDRLTREERNAFRRLSKDAQAFLQVEQRLMAVQPQRLLRIETYYLLRYPLTEVQYDEFQRGTAALDLPAATDEPEVQRVTVKGKSKQLMGRDVAAVRRDVALPLLQQLGARLPTEAEWEKAARGPEGWLYPWGNEWDDSKGFFYYGQDIHSEVPGRGRAVTGFPGGASPFGVHAMAGGLPELVTVDRPRPVVTTKAKWGDREILIDIRGTHAKESSAELAWFDHLVVLPGLGMWVSLRPALDKWPPQLWEGHRLVTEAASRSD